MANQTVSSSANHDDLTGRSAGEDFTINSNATLTIDSCPHLTSMGILGDITLSAGTLHIDGRYVKEIAYSSGSGTLPTAIPTSITWDSGASTGKIIRYDSGDNTAGVITVTVITGTLETLDTITDGTWTATVDTVKVGFLVIYGEDQDWGSVDGRSSLIINGDWYEVDVGDGTDSQTITLPHTGHQHAIWVETGNGTGVFQIWHRVASGGASTVYFNSLTQWGTTFESGFVFNQTFGSATVTFGTSTAGGVPPSGARIRIPNVHIGTTTTGAPTTEINSSTLATHASIIAPNTNLNVTIDHLNASSVRMEFIGTGAVSLSDSCWSLSSVSTLINKVNAAVVWDNCALINPGNSTGGMAHGALQNYVITDNVGGITLNNCVIMGALNANYAAALSLTTMDGISFTGTCKIVSNQQDENTCATLRGTVATNVSAETLICLGGAVFTAAGCSTWSIDTFVWGLPPGRGTTEQNVNWGSFTATKDLTISSGRVATGGAKVGTIGAYLITDSSDVSIYNHGDIDNKISGESRMTYIASIQGISSRIKLKRLWFTSLNSAECFPTLNSAANITIENCSGDYNDEIEMDSNRTLIKGVHGGSGGPGSTTGIEDDLVNVIGSCFYNVFTSDSAGLIGLVFNDKGNYHASDVTVTSGTPIFNGLGDLLMNTVGDQIVYEFPYSILGHTGFANTTPSKIGTSTANISGDYSINTGDGYSDWKPADPAYLTGETISPEGFRIKFRFTTTAGTNQNLRGFAVHTTTSIQDQKDNLYPLDTYTITLTDLQSGSEVRFYQGEITDPLNSVEIDGIENSTDTITLEHGIPGENAYIVIAAVDYVNQILSFSPLPASNQTLPIQQISDRVYANN